jgi:hypothetical protein
LFSFSLSHDDGSIGNTSDNLEAISEAASNHSVDSSLEDEDDPGKILMCLDVGPFINLTLKKVVNVNAK